MKRPCLCPLALDHCSWCNGAYELEDKLEGARGQLRDARGIIEELLAHPAACVSDEAIMRNVDSREKARAFLRRTK